MSSDSLGLIFTLLSVALAGLLSVSWMVLNPRKALFLFLAATLLLEHYPIAFPSITVFPEFYNNLNVSTGISALKFNPLEIILLIIGTGLACSCFRRSEKIPNDPVFVLGLIYFGWLLVATLWGLSKGGNWKIALWIARPVSYFLTTMLFVEKLIKSKQQALYLVALILLLTFFKSAQIIIRHSFSGIEKGSVEAYGSHECTSFALWSVWFILIGYFVRYKKGLGSALMLTLPVFLVGILFNERRVNFATLIVGIAILTVLQRPIDLKRRSKPLAALFCIGVLYFIVGWFAPKNPITSPVKSIKQGIRAELFGENTDNSSFYRKVERFNLKHTIRQNPIMGTGLGIKYLQIIKLDDLGFGYAVYISHNQVLLVHSATGSIGYFIFLLFFGAIMTENTLLWRTLKTPWARATALCAVLSTMNWLIVGYYDMQLFFFRNSVLMGAFLGLPRALKHIQNQSLKGQQG